MKSKTDAQEVAARRDEPAAQNQDENETPIDSDESSDLDEPDLQDADEERWEVFLPDDDCDPLPDYGDFWFPE